MGDADYDGTSTVGISLTTSTSSTNRPIMEGSRPADSVTTRGSKNSSASTSAKPDGPSSTATPDPQPTSSSHANSGQPSQKGDDAQQSHPMAATASSSSSNSAKDGASGTAAPYGTRSRNRPGTRPNYAEDVEYDFEGNAANGTAEEKPAASAVTTRSPSPKEPPPPQQPGGKKNGAWSTVNATRSSTGKRRRSPSPAAAGSRADEASQPATTTANNHAATGTQSGKKRKTNGSQQAANGAGHAHATAKPAVNTRKAAQNAASATPTPPARATPVAPVRLSNMYSFEKTKAKTIDGKLTADDGTVFAPNDHIYLVSEPPGEPYYIGRIMEFRHSNLEEHGSSVDSIRVNWVYRPRDVQRFNNDSRLVYATMHSDISPLSTLRGKCRVLHRAEIDDLDEYRKQKDSFWFNQVFDRFIHRWYEAIPTSQVINVPEHVKKVLDERWKYIVVEATKVKEFTSAVKMCKRCVQYCPTNESVECAECHNTYHMYCVRPPLLKKPSRGFAWACGPCNRAQEKRLEARRTPLIGEVQEDEEEFIEEEEDPELPPTTAQTPSDAKVDELHPVTQAEIELAKMWPMRYLGIHCRVEDALQYDDRAIYPRASSRIGPRHQAVVQEWYGRPVELVKPLDIKKKYLKSSGNKKDSKMTKETLAALEEERAKRANRPKWVQDEPPGYVKRGEDHPNDDPDNTAKLLFRLPDPGALPERGMEDKPIAPEGVMDEFMEKAKGVAQTLKVPEWSTDWLDRVTQTLYRHNFDQKKALDELKKTDLKKDLRDPKRVLSAEEQKRFAEGVAKYGSELRNVRIHAKIDTSLYGAVVRYWYIVFKKSPEGRKIWGNYGGRKSHKKKQEADATSRLLDDVAHDHDDSAFDNEKAAKKKRGFKCKHCGTLKSRQWRRAPGVAPGAIAPAEGGKSKDKTPPLVLALCFRCANLWRKYAVKWEEAEEIGKKVAQGGGRAWKRRIDEELLQEWKLAQESPGIDSDVEMPDAPTVAAPPPIETKKKGKSAAAADKEPTAAVKPAEKEKPKPAPPPPPPRQPTPPLVPAQPKMKDLPCAVCKAYERTGAPEQPEPMLVCAHCRLHVHRNCYGIFEPRGTGAWWICDMCTNDRPGKETTSYTYECVLCPVTETEVELVEQPRVSHKRKTDRDREKERLERELTVKLAEDYKLQQRQNGRPLFPREPLKRTSDNNWVHVKCAVWMPEVRFSNAKELEVAEGIPLILPDRYRKVCTICKKATKGACVDCPICRASFHVGCAHKADYIFTFDVHPTKATRRDVTVVTLGVEDAELQYNTTETGTASAAIICKSHSLKDTKFAKVHPPNESVATMDSELNALQVYVRNYKQADLTLSGTARKATLLDDSTKRLQQWDEQEIQHARTAGREPNPVLGRRVSTAHRGSRNSIHGISDLDHPLGPSIPLGERRCCICKVDTAPMWIRVKPGMLPTTTRRAGSSMPMDTLVNGIKEEPHQNGDANGSHLTNGVHSDAAPPKYMCSKCNWKRLNDPDPLVEPRESEPPRPSRELSARSPQPSTLPPPVDSGWRPGLPPLGPPTAAWPPPPPPVSVSAGLHGGLPAPSSLSQPPPHQPSYPPYPPITSNPSAALYNPGGHPVHAGGAPSPHVPAPPPYGYPAYGPPPPHAHHAHGVAPPPMHHGPSSHLPALSNGLPTPSPRQYHSHSPPTSAAIAGGLHPRDQGTGPPHLPPLGRTAGSPGGMGRPLPGVNLGAFGVGVVGRPETPKDGLREPPRPEMPRERAPAGASASPSLKNLLS